MRRDRDRYEPDREATGPRLWRDRLRRGGPADARSLTRVRRDRALARRSGRAAQGKDFVDSQSDGSN